MHKLCMIHIKISIKELFHDHNIAEMNHVFVDVYSVSFVDWTFVFVQITRVLYSWPGWRLDETIWTSEPIGVDPKPAGVNGFLYVLESGEPDNSFGC